MFLQELPKEDEASKDNLTLAVTSILAAQIILENFQLEQPTGSLLANVIPLLYNESLMRGFSGYNKEKCHESHYGEGTCGYIDSLGDRCNASSNPTKK